MPVRPQMKKPDKEDLSEEPAKGSWKHSPRTQAKITEAYPYYQNITETSAFIRGDCRSRRNADGIRGWVARQIEEGKLVDYVANADLPAKGSVRFR